MARLLLCACALLLLLASCVSASPRTLGAYLDATFGVGPYAALDLRSLLEQRPGIGNIVNLAGLQLTTATTAELNRLQPLVDAEHIDGLDFRSASSNSRQSSSKKALL